MSQHGPDESRTLAQRRADLFAELLLDGRLHADARLSAVRPRVLVTVPVLTLLGLSEEPASLDGYGPIDIDTARKLARLAPSFTRILTHPETGAVLSVGRDKYSVPRTCASGSGCATGPAASPDAIVLPEDVTSITPSIDNMTGIPVTIISPTCVPPTISSNTRPDGRSAGWTKG